MAHDKYSEHNYKQFVNIIKPALKGKDATRVADVLIERYGSIENVMSADRTELCELVGEGVAVRICPRICFCGESISKNAFRWFESVYRPDRKSVV